MVLKSLGSEGFRDAIAHAVPPGTNVTACSQPAGATLTGATSPSDAWAVGWVYLSALPGQTSLQSKTVIMHWNGSAWS